MLHKSLTLFPTGSTSHARCVCVSVLTTMIAVQYLIAYCKRYKPFSSLSCTAVTLLPCHLKSKWTLVPLACRQKKSLRKGSPVLYVYRLLIFLWKRVSLGTPYVMHILQFCSIEKEVCLVLSERFQARVLSITLGY